MPPPSGKGHIVARRASGETKRFELLGHAEHWLDEESSL